MKKNHLSPNAISHKDLNALLTKAKKDFTTIETAVNDENIEHQDFQDLITDWTKASKEILLRLNKNDQMLTRNRNSQALMAFGAMGAHINMALQALKATGFEK